MMLVYFLLLSLFPFSRFVRARMTDLSICRSCWLSDPLDKYVARRGTIFAAVLCCSSVIGAAFTQNWVQLLFCRCLLCIGMGSKASTVPVYAAENSAAFFRGSFVVDWQLWFACGIVL